MTARPLPPEADPFHHAMKKGDVADLIDFRGQGASSCSTAGRAWTFRFPEATCEAVGDYRGCPVVLSALPEESL